MTSNSQLLVFKLSTRESLKAGTLPFKDKENQPFFPVFIYDEQMMDGSLMKGLLRGPLLLKAGLSPLLRRALTGTHRRISIFSLAGVTQMG